MTAAGGSALSARSTGPRDVVDPLQAMLRHKMAQSRRPTSLAAAARTEPGVDTVLPDAGQVAVLDDSEGVAIPGGFDLDQKAVEFRPVGGNASQYTFALGASQFDSAAQASGTAVTLGDDDFKEVPLPFSFPFYGQRYNSLFIGSDGHIVFGVPEGPDIISLPRDFARMVVGPPRLAVLFTDLDPSQSGSLINFSSSAARFVVTWKNAPLYSDTPGPLVARQNFQAALFPDGRIVFSYNGVDVSSVPEVPVGLAPGGATNINQVDFVRFSEGSTATFSVAIVDDFSSTPQFDIFAVPIKFYRNHDDSYDFLVIYDTSDRTSAACNGSACSCALAIRNSVRGIGDRITSLGLEEFDATGQVGSAGRLQNLLYMGPLSRFPSDPNQLLAPAAGCGPYSALSVLAHESGHRFLAYPRFVDPATGKPSTDLLSTLDLAHWSFYFNAEASFVQGNQILDHGQGVSPRFETKQVVQHYSALDQYLMGLLSPDNVPTTFLVRQPSIDFLTSHIPQSGLLFDGTRLDITVPMIVAAEGKRAPDYTLSPKQFRFAFVYLTPAGATPSAADLSKMDAIRSSWENYFAAATNNLARADTKLVKQLQLSVWPASGIIQGGAINASVTLGAPATAAVTVTLAASNGSIGVPGSVTIPAGSRSAQFSITGNSPGPAQLTAQGPDSSYETSVASLQVRAGMTGLTLERLSTEGIAVGLILPADQVIVSAGPFSGPAGNILNEDLVFRVRDESFLPYPGLALTASVSGAGSITPSSPITDAQGRVHLTWTLDTNPGLNTLTVTLNGQPSASAKVQALGAVHVPRFRDTQ